MTTTTLATATRATGTLTAADLTAHRGAFTQFLGDVWKQGSSTVSGHCRCPGRPC
jgi:hypothetical protein